MNDLFCFLLVLYRTKPCVLYLSDHIRSMAPMKSKVTKNTSLKFLNQFYEQ